MGFRFTGLYAKECNCRIICYFHVLFLKNISKCFLEWMYHFTFHHQHVRNPVSPHPHQHFMLSERSVVMCYFGINLHFPNSQQYWISFHVLIFHLHIILGKMSLHVFCQYFNWIFLNLLNVENSLGSLCTRHGLLHVLQIYSPSLKLIFSSSSQDLVESKCF